jgi:hypothetical protein
MTHTKLPPNVSSAGPRGAAALGMRDPRRRRRCRTGLVGRPKLLTANTLLALLLSANTLLALLLSASTVAAQESDEGPQASAQQAAARGRETPQPPLGADTLDPATAERIRGLLEEQAAASAFEDMATEPERRLRAEAKSSTVEDLLRDVLRAAPADWQPPVRLLYKLGHEFPGPPQLKLRSPDERDHVSPAAQALDADLRGQLLRAPSRHLHRAVRWLYGHLGADLLGADSAKLPAPAVQQLLEMRPLVELQWRLLDLLPEGTSWRRPLSVEQVLGDHPLALALAYSTDASACLNPRKDPRVPYPNLSVVSQGPDNRVLVRNGATTAVIRPLDNDRAFVTTFDRLREVALADLVKIWEELTQRTDEPDVVAALGDDHAIVRAKRRWARLSQDKRRELGYNGFECLNLTRRTTLVDRRAPPLSPNEPPHYAQMQERLVVVGDDPSARGGERFRASQTVILREPRAAEPRHLLGVDLTTGERQARDVGPRQHGTKPSGEWRPLPPLGLASLRAHGVLREPLIGAASRQTSSPKR